MYARNVSFRLKSNMQSDYTRTFENEILPLLRKQKGFKDEITFLNPASQDAIAITLWGKQEQCRRIQYQHLSASVEDADECNRRNPEGSDL